MNVITDTIKEVTPRKKSSKYHDSNPVPWWDPDCDKAIRLRKASLKKWEFSNNLEDLINYNKNCALAKKKHSNKRKKIILKPSRIPLIFLQIELMYGINARS